MSEFAIGERVHIRQESEHFYPHVFWGRAGIITSARHDHDATRYLVDYAPSYGRYRVHEDDLERVEPRLVPVLTPTRVVHVKLDAYDIYIGRTMSGSQYRNQGWGNPFRVSQFAGTEGVQTAITKYREWLLGKPELLARLPELRGKVLGCWCAPKGGIAGDISGRMCHGEILAAMADDPQLVERLVAQQEAFNTAAVQYFERLAANLCPECGAKIERERQVGRCVYANPCGHRLYQGKTREHVERKHNEPEQTSLWDSEVAQ